MITAFFNSSHNPYWSKILSWWLQIKTKTLKPSWEWKEWVSVQNECWSLGLVHKVDSPYCDTKCHCVIVRCSRLQWRLFGGSRCKRGNHSRWTSSKTVSIPLDHRWYRTRLWACSCPPPASPASVRQWSVAGTSHPSTCSSPKLKCMTGIYSGRSQSSLKGFCSSPLSRT